MSPPQVIVAITMLLLWPAVIIEVETGMVDAGGIGIISHGHGDRVTPANMSENIRTQQNKYKIT